MNWGLSYRAHQPARKIADRHYNRQSVGAAQFVPPGRCVVLFGTDQSAVWVTSWPQAEFVQHAWAGAWVNSLFRNEGRERSSELIRQAIAATRYIWPTAPVLGMVTFVDPEAVPGVMVRGERIFGFCYLKAGFRHVGFTEGGLWAWQLLPIEMPEAGAPFGTNRDMFRVAS